MKNAKTTVFEYVEREILTSQQYKNGIDTSTIANALGMQRSNVSTLLNQLCTEGKLKKTNTRPVLYILNSPNNQEIESNCFEQLIGYDGSLKNPIQLAKAAVLYPKKSLNVLIVNQRGSGTTCFAETMYKFALERGVLQPEGQFVRINTLHYAKNIGALDEDLFGKDDDVETSVFAREASGFILIDNFHLLDGKQQARIFQFIETGELINEAGDKSIHNSNLTIIASCQPDNISELEKFFPIVINLPTLQDRPLREKFDLINQFFLAEAKEADRRIEVPRDVIDALMIHEFEYNVRELRQEIRIACANAFVEAIDSQEGNLYVVLKDFKSSFQKDLLYLKQHQQSIYDAIGYDYDRGFVYGSDIFKDNGESENIYNVIRSQFNELSDRGFNREVVDRAINAHVNSLFATYKLRYSDKEEYNFEQLSKVVDKKIINIVQLFLKEIENEYGKTFKTSTFYGLCLHINALKDKKFDNRRISDEQIAFIIENYPEQYAACIRLAEVIRTELSIELPMDEEAVLTMFIIEAKEEEEEVHPVLLYVLHGNRTAKSLAETTNLLTQSNNAYGYDIQLDVETTQSYAELKDLIVQIDNGAGVIVIYDMGSIKQMINMIQQEINVKIHSINIPITLIGIDVARRCSMETDIEYVYHIVSQEVNQSMKVTPSRRVIITLCHTGEGGAVQLKNYIDQYSHLGMRTIALSVSDRKELLDEISEIQQRYEIYAFVGDYDPKLLGIPFISIQKVFENRSEVLDKILLFEPVGTETFNSYENIYSHLEKSFEYTSINKLKNVLPNVIDEISDQYKLPSDQQIGLFIHLACVIERILARRDAEIKLDGQKIIDSNPDDYRFIRRVLKRVENVFKIIINDNEVATVIVIVKHLSV